MIGDEVDRLGLLRRSAAIIGANYCVDLCWTICLDERAVFSSLFGIA